MASNCPEPCHVIMMLLVFGLFCFISVLYYLFIYLFIYSFIQSFIYLFSFLRGGGGYLFCFCELIRWRLVLSILRLGSMGNVCCSKIKLSFTGGFNKSCYNCDWSCSFAWSVVRSVNTLAAIKFEGYTGVGSWGGGTLLAGCLILRCRREVYL